MILGYRRRLAPVEKGTCILTHIKHRMGAKIRLSQVTGSSNAAHFGAGKLCTYHNLDNDVLESQDLDLL